MEDYSLSKWKTNWDCDNLAASFKLYLQILHAKYNPYTFTERWNKKGENLTNVASVAVAAIYYKIDGDDRRAHSINLLICIDGFEFASKGNRHKLKKVYFEPEHGKIVKLTKKEERKMSLSSSSYESSSYESSSEEEEGKQAEEGLQWQRQNASKRSKQRTGQAGEGV